MHSSRRIMLLAVTAVPSLMLSRDAALLLATGTPAWITIRGQDAPHSEGAHRRDDTAPRRAPMKQQSSRHSDPTFAGEVIVGSPIPNSTERPSGSDRECFRPGTVTAAPERGVARSAYLGEGVVFSWPSGRGAGPFAPAPALSGSLCFG
ncbi:MAG: hypothetical protein JO168_05625 [Solirubrobacterales bacterium]|nr:hypothetical protein [Solirubrobacterales bacterium]